MTLQQALYVLLLYSANDVAVMIAEGISGSVAGFVELMNEEAQALGATNCHFTNPNGLTEDGHYMTAYDFNMICSMRSSRPRLTVRLTMEMMGVSVPWK